MIWIWKSKSYIFPELQRSQDFQKTWFLVKVTGLRSRLRNGSPQINRGVLWRLYPPIFLNSLAFSSLYTFKYLNDVCRTSQKDHYLLSLNAKKADLKGHKKNKIGRPPLISDKLIKAESWIAVSASKLEKVGHILVWIPLWELNPSQSGPLDKKHKTC